jgi:hypothetical protein
VTRLEQRRLPNPPTQDGIHHLSSCARVAVVAAAVAAVVAAVAAAVVVVAVAVVAIVAVDDVDDVDVSVIDGDRWDPAHLTDSEQTHH